MPLKRRAGTTGNRTALIDGDIIQYTAANVCNGTFYFHPSKPNNHFKYKKEARAFCTDHGLYPAEIVKDQSPESERALLHTIDSMIHTTMDNTGCSEAEVYLTGIGNFRETLATIAPYKGQRSSDKPYWFKRAKEHLVDKFGAQVIDGAEADDALGYQQWGSIMAALDLRPENHLSQTLYDTLDPHSLTTVICTTDKDLDMIPGLHYDWTKRAMSHITVFEADRAFYTQLLMGDRTDNIKGIKGCGDVMAGKILDGVLETLGLEDPHPEVLYHWYHAVTKVYMDTGATYEDMCETADLLWIQRVPNHFWTPPPEPNNGD